MPIVRVDENFLPTIGPENECAIKGCRDQSIGSNSIPSANVLSPSARKSLIARCLDRTRMQVCAITDHIVPPTRFSFYPRISHQRERRKTCLGGDIQPVMTSHYSHLWIHIGSRCRAGALDDVYSGAVSVLMCCGGRNRARG